MILLHFVHNYCTNSLEASKSFTGSNYRLVIQFILVTTPKNEDEFDWTSVEAISIPLFSSLSFLSFRETWREMNTTHINLSLAINPISLSRSSKNCDETNLCSLTKWWSGRRDLRTRGTEIEIFSRSKPDSVSRLLFDSMFTFAVLHGFRFFFDGREFSRLFFHLLMRSIIILHGVKLIGSDGNNFFIFTRVHWRFFLERDFREFKNLRDSFREFCFWSHWKMDSRRI